MMNEIIGDGYKKYIKKYKNRVKNKGVYKKIDKFAENKYSFHGTT